MARPLLIAVLALAASLPAQQPVAPPAQVPEVLETPASPAPLPDSSSLIHDVETCERSSEELRKKYFYRAATIAEETDKNGKVKDTKTEVREIQFIEGVLVDRIVERDGKPLSDKDKKKEDERVEKQVKEGKEKRAKAEQKGKDTGPRGNDVVSVARILELGSFSNPRRETYKGRSTILMDYNGDPHAKTHSRFEEVFKLLSGTVWIDEPTRCLVRGRGMFTDNFHIGGGLVVNIQKGTHFNFEKTLVNGEIWLPAQIDGEGSLRVLLFIHMQGRQKTTFSGYRKFQITSTILPGTTEVPDPQAEPQSNPQTEPAPPQAEPPKL